MRKIVVAGSLNMDLVAVAPRIPVVGETLTGSEFLTNAGGKGANQAFAAARLGGHVSMIGKVGSDDFGAQLVNGLREAGCDVSGIAVAPGHSGIAVIVVSQDGKNSIVVVPGANAQFDAAQVEASEPALAGAAILLLQLETPLPTIIAAARLAKSHGATVILDPAPAPEQPLPPELLANVDIITPNEVEAAHLTGRSPDRASDSDTTATAREIQELGVPNVVLKLGERGCLLMQDGVELRISAPAVRAVDSTAAGDCFNAALAVALAEGRALGEACHAATRAASLSVTRLGAQASMPSREELEEFLGSGDAAS
ncbi:ribokinase [Sphingopyxis sp. SE2]|uniref:ribokinase n=1 Tax=Sphingopyxis sp. SE2 TaxID=1586240 RepID=UPI0028BFA2F5|nr:ribokinase [Sphingopyxis sp. SE2]MDT7531611.1 ribokinase [Sphingopyxis sp. SE2]